MKKALAHLAVILACLLVLPGIPGIYYLNKTGAFSGTVDAVTGASMDLPDQPSGNFFVLINTKNHSDTLGEWTDFFQERPVGVIMEDINCLTVRGDVTGGQLADRYRARLAENQMKVRTEDGTLVVSRAEEGLADVIILSEEMADFYDYTGAFARSDMDVIVVSSTEESEGAAQ